MAETLVPSVEGRRRLTAFGLLAASTATGALAGFAIAVVLGVVMAAVSATTGVDVAAASPVPAAIMVAVGLMLDGARALLGRPTPWSVGRQVPVEWGRWFAPPVVAVLYGARLGVGPLTMLSTWGWWSALIAAAAIGPVVAVGAGALFGAVRIMVLLAASAPAWTATDTSAPPLTALARASRPARLTLAVLGVAAVSLVLVGCGAPAGTDEASPPAPSAGDVNDRSKPTRSVARGDSASERSAERPSPTIRRAPDSGNEPLPGTALPDPGVSTTPVTEPATLEDFVRLSPSPDAAARTESAPDDAPALAVDLVGSIDGFAPVTDSRGDRALDLTAASDIQPDPTEELALLETRGFSGGWFRAFRNETNDVAMASVYEFADETEAEFYLEDGLITIGGYGGRFFDLNGLPGVRGFTQTIPDGEGGELVSLGAAFSHGDRWYLISLVGDPETVTPEVLSPIISNQHELATGEASAGS
ncbi:MAG: hypothetical protein AAF467_10350 [Actinomycetota bacterium]